MMDIECYSEKEFQAKYNKRYNDVVSIAKKYGVDLSVYYFSQYLKDGQSEEVTYGNINNENICFDIQWWEGSIENVSVSMD